MSLDAHHVQDVGRILVQVQDQLKSLRSAIREETLQAELGEKLQGARGHHQGLSSSEIESKGSSRSAGGLSSRLEEIIANAEADIKAKTEKVLSSVVQATGDIPEVGRDYQYGRSSQSYDLYGGGMGSVTSAATSVSRVRARVESARELDYINNPNNDMARRYLQERFGIPNSLPRPGEIRKEKRRNRKKQKKKWAAKKKENRRLQRNEIALEKQRAQNRLQNSGVEGNALSSGVPPVTQAPMQFHRWESKFQRSFAYTSPFGFSISNVKLDVQSTGMGGSNHGGRGHTTNNGVQDSGHEASARLLSTKGADHDEGTRHIKLQPGPGAGYSQKAEEIGMSEAVEEIRGYNELLDQYSLHQFIIRKGKVLDVTPEFESFRRTHDAYWGPISAVIKALEDLCQSFAIPVAHIDGQAVVNLARDELTHATMEDLLQCVENLDHVSEILSRPGRRYVGKDGDLAAAVKIQSVYRGHVCRSSYLRYTGAEVAARLIQKRWKSFHSHRMTLKKLRVVREQNQRRWEEMQRTFCAEWESIKTKPRMVVHIPSISVDEQKRATLSHMKTRENMQMSRLCAVADPLVDVLYVAPFNLNSDVERYYHQLLEVGLGESPDSRYKIITPENADRFPMHMSLTQVLLYSPRAMKRIKNFLRGKEAVSYIVPGKVGPEERLLAIKLGIPLLAPDPDVAALYATKSGAKRIFSAAEVNIPPGAHDIYEESEAMATLSKLIASSIDMKRWIFKIDDEFGGRGLAYLDTEDVPAVKELRQERAKFNKSGQTSYWGRADVQEDARSRILSQLPAILRKRARIVTRGVYPTWKRFIREFCRLGGVLEAVWPEQRGSPSVNIFIEPSGHIQVTSTHEQLFSRDDPYKQVGALFPQSSVPHGALRGACISIGKQLYAKGVFGYIGVDFVTFFDGYTGSQRICAVDLNIGITPTAASFALFNFVMGGRYSSRTGTYVVDRSAIVPSVTGEEGGSVGALKPRLEERCYVTQPYLYHPNLGMLQYSAFFNLCRIKNVAFDLQKRLGTAFLLCDTIASGIIGTLAVGEDIVGALQQMQRAMEFIQDEVGGHSMKGEFDEDVSNFAGFKACIKGMLKRHR